MTTFVGEMGLFHGPNTPERPYFPSLSISPVFNVFNKIPQEGPWQIPKSFRQEKNWDALLQKWVRYLDYAAEGNQIYLRAKNTNIILGAKEDAQAWEYFNNCGLPEKTYEKSLEKIASVRRAFAALLSKKSQKHLKLEGDDIHASAEDIQNARTLVKNFEGSISYIPDLSYEEED